VDGLKGEGTLRLADSEVGVGRTWVIGEHRRRVAAGRRLIRAAVAATGDHERKKWGRASGAFAPVVSGAEFPGMRIGGTRTLRIPPPSPPSARTDAAGEPTSPASRQVFDRPFHTPTRSGVLSTSCLALGPAPATGK
jgi:hypothetical protein